MQRIHQLFEDQASRFPEAIAVAYRGHELSYAELDRAADALAMRLIGLGVGIDDRVPILLERSIEMIVAVLGVLKAGAAYVPVDPEYPKQRIDYMLSVAQSKTAISSSILGQRLLPNGFPYEIIDKVETPESSKRPNIDLSEKSLAYVIFTSGSTGEPKGVAMPHNALANLLDWQGKTIPLETGERTLQFTSLSFDVSFQEIFTSLTAGGTLVLVDNETRRDPESLWSYIEANQINRLYLPFIALQQLAEAATSRDDLPSSLKEVITAGEQLQSTATIRALFKRLPKARLRNHYGPSETHVVTAYTLPKEVDLWTDLPPIGTVIDNSSVIYIDDSGNPREATQGGELCFGGECLARGYLNRDDLTAERFVQIKGQRYYKTGDLGRADLEGNIQYLGRTDQQVKIRGHRVELGEIETQLNSHPTIRECVVAAIERSGIKELIAFVVGSNEKTIDPVSLKRFLRERLAEYLVPNTIEAIKALPLTPSGKIDRKKLSTLTQSEHSPPPNFNAPRSGPEEQIATIWSEILGQRWISRSDSFFDIGGSSITIVNVRNALREKLDKDIPLTILFQYPTISGIALYFEEGSKNSKKTSNNLKSRAAKHRAALARTRSLRSR